MISHKYKCIFIHIPRTGGSSIEKLVSGKNWWSIDPATKHLLASQAKKLYSEWWDEYFKFAFVRDPYDRAISMLNFAKIYYGSSDKTKLTHFDLDWYKETFGFPISVEYDYRFWCRDEVFNSAHGPNQVYSNILDEELDFIGRFENLQDDVNFILSRIGCGKHELTHEAASKLRKAEKGNFYQDDVVKNLIKELYYNDFMRYGYQMDWRKRQ